MSHASSHSAQSPHHEGGDASDGVNIKKVITIGVVSLALFAAGIIWAVYLLHAEQEAIRKTGAAGEGTELFKAEIGIVDNALFTQDNRLQEYKSERKAWLNGYGWSDRKAGLIHIPIERAMAEVVAEASRPEVAPQLPPPPPSEPEPVKANKASKSKAAAKVAPAPGAPH